MSRSYVEIDALIGDRVGTGRCFTFCNRDDGLQDPSGENGSAIGKRLAKPDLEMGYLSPL
jgi:hypothetical protein